MPNDASISHTARTLLNATARIYVLNTANVIGLLLLIGLIRLERLFESN